MRGKYFSKGTVILVKPCARKKKNRRGTPSTTATFCTIPVFPVPTPIGFTDNRLNSFAAAQSLQTDQDSKTA